MDVQKKWGLSPGVRLETKGMETKAAVKNYGMAIIQDGATVSGRWTGMVQTRYHSQQLVFPLTAVFKAHKRLKRFTPGHMWPLRSAMILTDMSMTAISVKAIRPARRSRLRVTHVPTMISVTICAISSGVCRAA